MSERPNEISAPQPQWYPVAEAMKDRLDDLGWSRTDLAYASRVSPSTVRALLDAKKTIYRRKTLTSLARALGWPASAFEEILRTGEPPEPVSDPPNPAAPPPGSGQHPLLRRVEFLTARQLRIVQQLVDELQPYGPPPEDN